MTKLTLQEVERRMEAIFDEAGDNEVMHVLEDNLYQDFIRHVAKTSKGKLGEMAHAILKVVENDYIRWYA